jgi:hypothetical protein
LKIEKGEGRYAEVLKEGSMAMEEERKKMKGGEGRKDGIIEGREEGT